MSFFQELKRRNVFRVAGAYLAGAWLLIEVVQSLFPLYGLSDGAVRLVVTLLAIGFPLAVILSWVFELTPKGFKFEKDIDRSAASTYHQGKKLDRAIIVLLALSLAYFAFDKFVLEPSRVAELVQSTTEAVTEQVSVSQKLQMAEKSIAVLPFANLSPNPENEYFSDGLTEELIGSLAKVEGLHVTSRTSAFAFKGDNRDIREIGDLLNVKTVLEGSVRREQNRVRVTAQLIKVEDGFHLWSETYDYEMVNVLVLEETVSLAIVSALQVQLSPKVDQQFREQASVNPQAYDLYLKGRYYWARLSEGGFLQSIQAFQQAIAIDPEYAPPHAGLANAYSFSGYFGVFPPREAFPLSIKEAEAALALDPGSSEALVARGMAWLVYEWNWDRARDSLELALELSPNSSFAHWAYTEYLTVVDPAKALESALHALSLDPLSLPIMNLVAFAYLERGMYDDAQRMDEEMIAMDPGFDAAHWNMGIIHTLHGQYEDAIEDLGRSVENSGGMPPALAMLAYAHAKSGDQATALDILAKLESRRQTPGRGYASPVLIAHVYEGLGRADDALAWLEKAVTERDGWLVILNAYPRFDSLRGEPRFKSVLREVGLPESDRD